MSAETPTNDPQPNFTRIERRGVADDGISQLKSMILSGELTAGQRLPPERELAELLGVSRPTLREAVRALISLNILESRHGHGTYVTSLDPALLAQPIDFILQLHAGSLAQLVEARKIIEPPLTRLATERATPEQLAALEALLRSRQAADDPSAPDWKRSAEIDIEFHRVIAEMSGNLVLATFLNSIKALSRASRAQSQQHFSHDPGVGARDLSEILAAMQARDPDAAESAMQKHMDRIASAFVAMA
jgi:DNA-binding FadR family transcriptional regulator